MKPWSILFVCIALATAGCATHYHRVENGRAYLFLKAKKAESVLFASSVDRFQWRSADKISSDTWRVTLSADIPQSYIYLVDDRPVVPDCRFKEKDDFGSENCVYLPGL